MQPADDLQSPRVPSETAKAQATWFGQLEQRDFDADFYERLVAAEPNNVRILRLLGELYARQGRYHRALEIDQKLVELVPGDSIVHYNLACSLAMLGQLAPAIVSLGRAVGLGYNDFSHLEVDPELNPLRNLPQFQSLLAQYGISS